MRSLSVVVPAYNEQDNLVSCVQNIKQVLKTLKLESEIIIVDDGSKDKTGELADSLAKKYKNIEVVHNHPNRGYGGSLKAGFAKASKEFIAFFPSDNQFDFAEVVKFIEVQEKTDADIVSGIRPGGGRDSWYRLAVRWAANSLVRAVFGYLATDVDCGFKVFRRSILEKVTMPSDGALIDTEMYAGARARDMKIEEIPVKHLPRTAGSSTGGNPSVLFKALVELVGFWWQLKNDLRVERGKNVFKWEVLVIVAILAVAAFVRLYKVDQYMTFLGDEGRDVQVVRDMLIGRNFPFIGPGTSVGNMYLGPWYYYIMGPALLAANFSPVGPAVLVAILSLATTWLLWWAGRQWFGRGPALMVSLLYSLSPVIIIYSRSSWNPNVMPLFALVFIYAIWKVWKYHYWRWAIVAAAAFALVLNSHYLGLLLLAPAAWVFLLSLRQKGWGKYLGIAAVVFVVMMSPLLIFDLNPVHRFQNIGNIIHFFADRQTTVNVKVYKAIPNLWPLSTQIIGSLVTANYNTILTLLVTLGLYFFAAIQIVRRKVNKDLGIVLLWLGGALVGLGLYKQHIYDHYFGFIFPAPFLLLGFIAEKLKKWFIPVLLLLLAVMLLNSPLRYSPNNQLAHTKEIADAVIQQAGGRPFNFALVSKRNYDKSYIYFLDLNNAPIYTTRAKLADQLYVVCEDPECNVTSNPDYEIASFGWSKIDQEWDYPWGVKLFKLVHNPSGKPS